MAVVIAGRSSLGTEAASTAFTDPGMIAKIREQLQGNRIDLEDHKQPFWGLASMDRTAGDGKEEAVRQSLKVHHFYPLRRA